MDSSERFTRVIAATRRQAKDWARRWRRARVTRRRGRNRKTYVLLATFALLLGTFGWCLRYLAPDPTGRQLTIDQVGTLAAEHRLVSATFRDEDAQVVGSFACGDTATVRGVPTPKPGASPAPRTVPFAAIGAPVPGCEPGHPAGTVEPFWVSYPKSDSATALLIQATADAGARVRVQPQTAKASIRLVTTLVLPLMLLANLFVLLFAGGKGASSGIGEVETFGSIGKGRFGRKRKTPVTFAEVAGADEAVEELKEVRDYIANPERYQEIGALPPKGVLLVGPPGCGKTLLAKAVAGEVGVPFFSVAAAEFVESLVGVGAARVRDLFARVRSVAPAVVFIDELDAAGRKRGSGGGAGGNEEREQTLNQLLVEMDGFDVSSGIVVMAATNRPDILDPALLRPGRFDRQVTVDRPDVLGRTKILGLHARGKPLAHGTDLGQVARRTPGFSGADLANVVNEAALLAVRQGKAEIDAADLEDAVQRTLSGTVRRGRTLTPEERKRAAFHESGHVVVAAASGLGGDVHRVSILTAGRNVGTTSRADAEAVILTRAHLLGRLAAHLAGMVAEEMVFGDPSTGSEQDVERATRLARDIVARYGMTDALGSVRYLASDTDAFLDADVPLDAVSGTTHQDIDAEVRRLIDEGKRDALQVLAAHRETLGLLAARLEAEETLEGADLEEFLVSLRPEAEMFGNLLASTSR